MRTWIKDLKDYSLVKNCCRCGFISLKVNFYKKIGSKDAPDPQCIP